jgi:hypothetical protein
LLLLLDSSICTDLKLIAFSVVDVIIHGKTGRES